MPTDLRVEKMSALHPLPRAGFGVTLGRRGGGGGMEVGRVHFLSPQSSIGEAKSGRGPRTWWKFPSGLSLLLMGHSDVFHGSPLAYKVSFYVLCAELVSQHAENRRDVHSRVFPLAEGQSGLRRGEARPSNPASAGGWPGPSPRVTTPGTQ